MKVKDLTGQSFGRLTVIRHVGSDKAGHALFECVCSCPDHNTIVVSGTHLKSGHTLSCGCVQKERASAAKTKWQSEAERDIANHFRDMKKRCTNPNNKEYHRYGGRGITICKEWMDDRSKFVKWSLEEGGYAKGLSIERNNNNGPYAPWNCSWIRLFDQAGNKSNNVKFMIDGRVHTVAEWARIAELDYEKLRVMCHNNPQEFMSVILESEGYKKMLREEQFDD